MKNEILSQVKRIFNTVCEEFNTTCIDCSNPKVLSFLRDSLELALTELNEKEALVPGQLLEFDLKEFLKDYHDPLVASDLFWIFNDLVEATIVARERAVLALTCADYICLKERDYDCLLDLLDIEPSVVTGKIGFLFGLPVITDKFRDPQHKIFN